VGGASRPPLLGAHLLAPSLVRHGKLAAQKLYRE
jgi:hypothetical protein